MDPIFYIWFSIAGYHLLVYIIARIAYKRNPTEENRDFRSIYFFETLLPFFIMFAAAASDIVFDITEGNPSDFTAIAYGIIHVVLYYFVCVKSFREYKLCEGHSILRIIGIGSITLSPILFPATVYATL